MTDILDDLFHACAFHAFIIESRAVQDWPDREKVRQRAYELFEAELAKLPPARSP